jgi:hypothetical protein
METAVSTLPDIEVEHFSKFQDFYDHLPDRRDLFYMFFSTGLLHWAARASRFVPKDVNLVVLGSGLSPEELAWAQQNIRQPFHHIALRVDDKSAWEFLFEANRHHFGWIDVDCFVLNPGLFHEMAQIAPDVSMNCAWTFPGPNRQDILLTYFIFMNIDAIRAVAREIPITPCTYSYDPASRGGRTAPHAPYARVLEPQQIQALGQFLPLDAQGRPACFSETSFFDTLQVYQFAARSLGYRLHKVRTLNPMVPASRELLHLSKVSYYKGLRNSTSPKDRWLYKVVLRANYLLLDTMAGQVPPLPESYGRLREELRAELQRLKVPVDPTSLREDLEAEMALIGVDASAISRVLWGEPPFS